MTHERGSRPLIRRCRLNVRFARKRTRPAANVTSSCATGVAPFPTQRAVVMRATQCRRWPRLRMDCPLAILLFAESGSICFVANQCEPCNAKAAVQVFQSLGRCCGTGQKKCVEMKNRTPWKNFA
jgi:hypothetical protein